jgi:N-acetylglutamate synthase-like GNAT family acetyltransferase
VAFLFWIYIIPTLRGRGTGKQLLQSTEQACAQKGHTSLQLVTHNHREYYQKNGFDWSDTVVESDNNITMHLMEKQLHA